MKTLRVDILDPKATKLLKDLADLDLIAIRESKSSEFTELIKKIRSKTEEPPSLEQITREVEAVRAERFKS